MGKLEFSSEQTFSLTSILFEKQLHLLELAKVVCDEEQGQKWFVVNALIYTVIDSAKTIVLLTKQEKIRDIYIIARVVCETVINICFICAKGEIAVEDSIEHSLQKSYRDLTRESEVNGLKIKLNYKGKVHPSVEPVLEKALTDFTFANGRENTHWTKETLIERLEVMGLKYGEKASGSLQFSLFSIYRHASEISHGPFFGALFSLGLTQPTNTRLTFEEFQAFKYGSLSMVLLMLAGSINALLYVISKELNSIPNIVAVSDNLISEFKREIE